MTDLDPLVQDALEVLSSPLDRPGDWEEVLLRARENGGGLLDPTRIEAARPQRRRRTRRRRLILVALVFLVVLAVLFAVPALGLRDRLVELLETGDPAPIRVVKDFQRMDIAAPPGMATGVRFRQARLVHERWVLPGWKALIYAAPTRNGGFCEAVAFGVPGGRVRDAWAGCRPPQSRGHLIGTTAGGFRRDDPRFLTGSVTAPEAVSLVLRFEDGETQMQPLTWIGRPIDAASSTASRSSLVRSLAALRESGRSDEPPRTSRQ